MVGARQALFLDPEAENSRAVHLNATRAQAATDNPG